MMLWQLVGRVYLHANDPGKQRFDRFNVEVLLNEAQEEFCRATGLLITRSQISVTSGVGDLTDANEGRVPGAPVGVVGEILRVEDASNNNKVLSRTSERKLDILIGPAWRLDTAGPLKYWMRGIPNEGSQTGFETIIVYPLVSSGTVNVFHRKQPRSLDVDSAQPEIPAPYHMALVWHTVYCLLANSADPTDKTNAEYAKMRYDDLVAKGVAEGTEG